MYTDAHASESAEFSNQIDGFVRLTLPQILRMTDRFGAADLLADLQPFGRTGAGWQWRSASLPLERHVRALRADVSTHRVRLNNGPVSGALGRAAVDERYIAYELAGVQASIEMVLAGITGAQNVAHLIAACSRHAVAAAVLTHADRGGTGIPRDLSRIDQHLSARTVTVCPPTPSRGSGSSLEALVASYLKASEREAAFVNDTHVTLARASHISGPFG